MISELITDHDMVGLPGLGTFVAEVVPATFSDKGYTINPPYRRLSFHPSRSEDTLLIDFYAASNGISKEAAALYLKQFLAEMKTVLKERKTIALPGLGRLRATVENNFFFVPDPDLDIYPDGFGLEPLSLKTITEPEPVDIPLVHQSRETVSAAVADTATVAETAPATEIATTTSQGAAPVSEMNSALVSETETVITQSLGATPAIATEPAAEQAAASQPQPEPQPKAESQLAVQPYPAAEAASVSVSALPTEASAVRTGLKSCAPGGVVRTERSEEGVPCAPDGILRTEVPFVRTGAEFSAPGYGEHGNDGGPLVRTAAAPTATPATPASCAPEAAAKPATPASSAYEAAKPLHPVVHLHIVSRDGRIYLQQRSATKDLLPLRWDTAVGGHVAYGEYILEALYREASEELGFTDFNPVFITSYVFESEAERELVNVFATVGDFTLKPDGDEVIAGRYWSPEEIEAACGKNILTPNFESEYHKIKNSLQALL